MQKHTVTMPSVGFGETGTLEFDNLTCGIATLVITTPGGTVISASLPSSIRLSITAGNDVGEVGYVVNIDPPEGPAGLRLVKKGEAHD